MWKRSPETCSSVVAAATSRSCDTDAEVPSPSDSVLCPADARGSISANHVAVTRLVRIVAALAVATRSRGAKLVAARADPINSPHFVVVVVIARPARSTNSPRFLCPLVAVVVVESRRAATTLTNCDSTICPHTISLESRPHRLPRRRV